MNLIDNFLKSGFEFESDDFALEGKYKITNIVLLLVIFAIAFGIVNNINYPSKTFLIYIEIFLITLNILIIYLLRFSTKYFFIFQNILILEFSLFFTLLFYISSLDDMKFLWIFVYPLILLHIQSDVNVKYWFLIMVIAIAIAPYQTVIDVAYTKVQTMYIIVVFIIESLVVYFYYRKMSVATDTIMSQRKNLEIKLDELIKKDKMLTTQSRQAVMGEMMSMIAHQWRQPLSSVTLQISNLQLEKMLGNKIDDEKLERTLGNISDTLVYLSNTVDDFQTYFHPNKVKSKVEIHELLQKAVNFARARADSKNIEISINKTENIEVITYENELIQIVLNLINNAIDALVQKDSDKLMINIHAEDLCEYIEIYVEDNGVGISEENIEKIFEPYFSTKGKNGTGLGLYMSQIIAQKQFDGEISVESSNSGTSFLVSIKKDVNL